MRTKAIRVVLDEGEFEAVLRATNRLAFEFPGPAARTLFLAINGDEAALRRVAPFLDDFCARLAALDQGGR